MLSKMGVLRINIQSPIVIAAADARLHAVSKVAKGSLNNYFPFLGAGS